MNPGLFDWDDDAPVTPKEQKRKVVFFPFGASVEGFPGHYTYPNRFEDVHQDPIKSWQNVAATVFADDNSNKKTLTLGMLSTGKDTLYIMGQCAPGSEHLHSLNTKHKIDAPGIVALLKGYLKTEFAGKVKVYACHSATGGASPRRRSRSRSAWRT
ncbi:MAG: hypothetical protein SFV54_25335 [Bryobacteraceae bacterium]|nr:hypothetical protein [Bryobacteraceae bacterium]